MTDRSARALGALLGQAGGLYTYFNQDKEWAPRPPRERVSIADMDPAWRFNSAAMLLRNAAAYAERYSWGELAMFGDAPDDVQHAMECGDDERRRNPQRWMRGTQLFRALVRGLPETLGALTEVAELGRHLSTCPARTAGDCGCKPGQLADLTTLQTIADTAETTRKADERAAAERAAAEQREADRQALRDWMAANPGIDPDTNRPWGVDEDGINHNEPHGTNDHCNFDSCRNCGGYHCGLFCPEEGDDQQC